VIVEIGQSSAEPNPTRPDGGERIRIDRSRLEDDRNVA
jgi:hypothetical protein